MLLHTKREAVSIKDITDDCWYNGRHELCKELYPGQYEWCSSKYHRCVECLDNVHCPPERPWCDWDMECEECVLSTHCPTGESCLMRNGHWVCRVKDCVDYREEGDPNYCANNFSDRPICDVERRRCVECIAPSDCKGERETCIESKCVDESEMDCMQQIEAGFLNYCEMTYPERPVCHTQSRECVECQFDNQCKEVDEITGKKTHTCARTRCIPKEWECRGPEDCISDDYKCVNHECILKDCSEYDDPDAYCSERRQEGWRCLGKVCVRCIEREDCHEGQFCENNKCVEQTCDKYKNPTKYCQKLFGSAYCCVGTSCVDSSTLECDVDKDCVLYDRKCINHECILKLCTDYDDPDEFCNRKATRGWRCRADGVCVQCLDSGDCTLGGYYCSNYKCVSGTCDQTEDPDKYCQNIYGKTYNCIDKECVDVSTVKCSDYLSTAEADAFCEGKNSAKPHCDFYTGRCHECNLEQHCPVSWICKNHLCLECSVDGDCDRYYRCTGAPDWRCIRAICTDQSDPDGWCYDQYGGGYECIDKLCVLTDCLGSDHLCPEGYYCPEHECIWGCEDGGNCPDAKPHCSLEGSCVECWGPAHCGVGYDCLDYVCIKQEDCLKLDSLCSKNEYCNIDHCEEGCRDRENCAEVTPECSQKTGRCEECIYDKHCEDGYDCDDYKCVWVGFDCSYDLECPTNWFCSNNFCVFGCNVSDENCAKETPHCSQETGKCEECWSPEHCEWWQECIEYRCVARKDNAECKPGDKKHGKRCRDGIWVDIECKGPEDCLGHEYCDDGICRDKERGCDAPTDCPSGYYCDLSSKLEEFHKCVKQICRGHDECPVGQGCDYAGLGQVRDNAKTRCISWRDYYCSEKDPCPEGWTCDRGSGKCVEALCGPGRACQDDRYECVNDICVPRRCEDRSDPQGYCMEQEGWYGRCVSGACVVLDCSWYPDPDLMCRDTEGENWRCVKKRCIDFGASAGGDPKQYCSEILGIDEAYWDFEKHSCEVPDCDTVADPDKLCVQLKDPRYKCREGECRRGREGEECARTNECATGLRCGDGLCIEKECIRWQDCDDPEKWCNHGVCEPLRTECEGPADCRDDYHCDAGGQCAPNDCEDHYDCGEGECCNANKECVRCELHTCWYNFHCRRGWSCNLETNKCQRVGCTIDSQCEEGFYCDLDDGICRKIEIGEECWGDQDCPEGQVCKGARGTKWVQGGGPFWKNIRKKQSGICVDKDVDVIRIEGIDDERTCDYCRSMFNTIFKKGEGNLPPYHDHCRCFGVYED